MRQRPEVRVRPRPRRRILVLVPHGIGFARRIVVGVREHALVRGDWTVISGELPRSDLGYPVPAADGIICLCGQEGLEAALLAQPAPVVNVSARLPRSRLPRVVVDNLAVGRHAAEHLVERGYRRFAFAPASDMHYSNQRLAGFLAALHDHDLAEDFTLLTVPDLDRLLAAAPHEPVGVLAANDDLARRVADGCADCGLAVPEQVGIAGVDNDPFVCDGTPLGLTSVDTCGRQVGLAAAHLLAELMDGQPPPAEERVVPCGPVVVRQSTDTLACADPAVAFAAAYIRDHACDPLRVDRILEHLALSRRTLEKRFRHVFARSLHDEIRRQQVARARRLLAETDLPVHEVAWRTGFCDRIAFGRAFRAAAGQSPSAYRQAAARPPTH